MKRYAEIDKICLLVSWLWVGIMCDLLNEEIVCILNSLFPEQLQHNAISNIIIEDNPENTAEEADEEGSNGEKPIWN